MAVREVATNEVVGRLGIRPGLFVSELNCYSFASNLVLSTFSNDGPNG